MATKRIATRKSAGTKRAARRGGTAASRDAQRVVARWQSSDGPRTTVGELLALDDRGYLVLREGRGHMLWIPRERVFHVTTRTDGEMESARLEEATAVQAAAVIEAVAESAREDAADA